MSAGDQAVSKRSCRRRSGEECTRMWHQSLGEVVRVKRRRYVLEWLVVGVVVRPLVVAENRLTYFSLLHPFCRNTSTKG